MLFDNRYICSVFIYYFAVTMICPNHLGRKSIFAFSVTPDTLAICMQLCTVLSSYLFSILSLYFPLPSSSFHYSPLVSSHFVLSMSLTIRRHNYSVYLQLHFTRIIQSQIQQTKSYSTHSFLYLHVTILNISPKCLKLFT